MTKKSYKEQKSLALEFLENVRKQNFEKAIEVLNIIEKNENYFWNEVWNATGEDSEADSKFLLEFLNIYSINSENSIYWNLIKSIQLSNAGLKKEAYQHLLNLVNTEPQTTSLYYDSLGRISFRLKKQDEAVSYFEKAIQVDPNQTVLLNNLGFVLCELKEYEKGIPYLEKGIELDSDYPIIQSHLGDAYFELKDYEKAIEFFKKACELDSTNPIFWNELGMSYFKIKDFDNAVMAYSKAIELDSSDASYQSNMGKALFEIEDYKTAIEYYNKAIELNPQKASYYSDLGLKYLALKNYNEALNCYKKAIELKPNEAYYNFGLGLTFSNLKLYDEAIQAYDKAIKIDSNEDVFFYSRGDLYSRLEDYENANESYLKALEINPKKTSYYLNIGNTYFQLKNYEKAIDYYAEGINLDSKHAYFYCYLGFAYLKLEEYDKAISFFNQAIDLEPNESYFWAGLGMTYYEMNEYNKAIEFYSKAIELNPLKYAVYIHISHVYYREKQYSKCKEHLIKAIELSDEKPMALSASLFLFKKIYNVTKEKEFHELYKNAYIELSKLDSEEAFKAYEEQNEKIEDLSKKEEEYDEQKKLISFLSHTFTNALGSEHQTLESSIKSLQKGKAESNWNLVGSSLNRLVALSGNFLQLENLIRFFKLIVREPEEFQKQWESDTQEEISVRFIFALILKHLFSNLLYSSDPAIRRKLFGENTNWNALRQSFDETILQIELREEDDSISNYIKWVKSNCPQVHFLIEDNTTKVSKFGIRMNSIYAVMGEFIQNALKYSKLGTKVQFEWKREGSEISFFCRNEFDDQSTKTQGTKKGKYFIDKLTDILRRQSFVIPRFEDKDGTYKTSFQITMKDEIK